METGGLQLLICLITAHLAADFLLQTENDVHRKHTFRILIKHSSIHALLAYFLTGIVLWWQIPVSILVTHALIDRTKAHTRTGGILTFLLDQLAHLLVLVLLAVLLPQLHPGEAALWSRWAGTYYQALLLISGAILVTRFGGILIGTAAAPYLLQLQNARNKDTPERQGVVDPLARGFDNGGFIIGQLERSLIYILVLANQAAAITILIAAKSLFRFGEIRDRSNRMEAEYILIGTLMSFLFALAVSYTIRSILPLL